MLWKYNIKQALKFPENVGIKFNAGKEFLPQKHCSKTNISFIKGLIFFLFKKKNVSLKNELIVKIKKKLITLIIIFKLQYNENT